MTAGVVVSLRHAFVARLSEWQGATILFMWGVVLLQPPAIYENGPAWTAISLLVDEQNLGWLFLTGGALRLMVLAANGAWRPMYYIRAWMAFSSAIVWLIVSMGFASANFYGTWAGVYPVLFIFETVNLFRAVSDAAAMQVASQVARGIGNDR